MPVIDADRLIVTASKFDPDAICYVDKQLGK
jgi:hypothetical protein